MNPWASVTLGDICSFITDGKHGDCANDDESGFYFISAKDVRDGRISYESARQITEADFAETHRRTNLKPGDILVTNSGTIGRLAIATDDEVTTRTTFQKSVAILKVKHDRVSLRFLYYTLAANHSALNNEARGAAQKNLLLGDLRRLTLRIPQLATQAAIADILSAYDGLIENNRRRMALLEEAARQLYREWFVRLRFPGHEHTGITNGAPEGWERVPTPVAIEINPTTRLSDESEHWSVEMADLPSGSMVIQQATRREGRSGSKFRNGDTLFARITPCLENGKTAFVDFLDDGQAGRGSTEFIVLRAKRVTPEYVYCLARTHDFRGNAIKSMVGSSGRQRVQESCFNKFNVLIPPDALLALFTDFARSQFQLIKALHAQNHKLRAARDLLLPRLMSGQLAV